MNQGQQGDVCWERVERVPEGATRHSRTPRGVVLAEGEATGHAHRILEEAAELYEHEGMLYLKNAQPVTVRHEEHAAQVIEPGVWEIGRVQRWDYLRKAREQVRD